MEVWFLLLAVYCSAMGMLALVRAQPGFINIDCGAQSDNKDGRLGIDYKADDGFIDSGYKMNVANDVMYEDRRPTAYTLRAFPNGTRNCYTIPVNTTGSRKYLTRASFLYGNYDHLNNRPKFDLHIGVSYWATVGPLAPDDSVHKEIIYVVPPRDEAIQVCLVNTGYGNPFISSLELRQLSDTMYTVADQFQALFHFWRLDVGGSSDDSVFRFPSDVYDRFWAYDNNIYNLSIKSTLWDGSALSDPLNRTTDEYKVPVRALKTIATVQNSSILRYRWKPGTLNSGPYKWIAYFHFAEMAVLPSPREFTIYCNELFVRTISLDYLVPVTVPTDQFTSDKGNFSYKLVRTSSSNKSAPPILNALELYYLLNISATRTFLDDVNAMNIIKRKCVVNKYSWQGDPCVPTDLTWEGLNCSTGQSPRITSLNLSSSGLKGILEISFAKLKALELLDLSHNQLTGPVPEFLAELENLSTLILSGNNFIGSIPESLRKKADDGSLHLENIQNNPKKKRNPSIFPVISVAGSVSLLLIVLAIIWRVKSKKGPTKGTIRSKNRNFAYKEVLNITLNFKTVIGEGGFGKVYLGTMADGTQVAVKMLSRTSRQGNKEFEAEAQLLMIVHHRNLVSLVGYCDQPEKMALIYEFMENGNLRHYLSGADQSVTAHVLTWNERLQIAIDAAQGLDYLHNGCKPPIIHRDLKTPNILLNENMQAKIADFGLSKAFAAEDDTHISTRPAGTPGYLDPEFQSSGNLNRKSDVYSFGVILMELITGYPAMMRSPQGHIHIVQWVRPIIERGDIQSIVDPRLDGKFNVNSAWKLVEIAMSCVPATAIQRPDISHVLVELKECLAMETASNRTGSIKRRSTGSFEMQGLELDDYSVPEAR